MSRWAVLSVTACLWISSSAVGVGRIWVLPIDHRDGSGWVEEPTGGYSGTHEGRYWWAEGKDGARRAWWRFTGTQGTPFAPYNPAMGNTTEEPAEERRLYFIDTWVPPAHANVYSVIEVESVWGIDPNIPWNGFSGVNRQYMSRYPSDQNNWVQAGINPAPGPQAPLVLPGGTNAMCATGRTGSTVWLKRGDWLYVKWDWDDPANFTTGVSAIRITEFNANPPVDPPCGPAAFGGMLDLRCAGNTDPFYGLGASLWWDTAVNEPFANAHAKMIAEGDHSFAAEGYKKPCTSLTGISPGLPSNGVYTAHLPDGSHVNFQLRYEGFNSIKWDTGQTSGPFSRDNVFALNGTPGREFVVGPYRSLHLLSTKNSGHNGQLLVELVYEDTSTETFSFALYEWFNSDGDPTSIAVGLDGEPRSNGNGVHGFQRINNQGEPGNGGDHGGAFFFVHPVTINPDKTLTQVNLRVSEDGRGLSGSINIVAITMVPRLCNTPSADADGDLDVDQTDFAELQRCLTAAHPIAPVFCKCFDLSGPFGVPDGSIGMDDLQKFADCATGPEVTWVTSPACP
jgi:hypothetical protein